MTTETDKLMEGVLRGDSRALRDLLVRLRTHCTQILWDRFARLGDTEAEILDDTESLLFEWSVGPRARERLPKGETLGALAFRLVSQVTRQKQRQDQRQERLVTDVPSDGDAHADPPAAGFGTDGIVAVIEALPEFYRNVLVGEVRFQQGLGPPLDELLSVSRGAARVRLTRARAVLLRALRERGLSELIDPEATDG